ncbi:MAG: family 1 glycosylhydrolase [Spirochaetia bacterium]
MEKIAFPAGFIWGAASSAYQCEGSPLADGASASNWHEFTRRRGVIRDGTTGDTACDNYHRYPEDIAEMQRMGLKAYRFSAGWGRIFPEAGQLNARGLDHYDRMVDQLAAARVEPWLTIFHLEEPLWLTRMGGFSSRAAVDHLVELGAALFARLGDRVHNWITVNEPTVYAYLGHATGEFPPGRKLDLRGAFACLHHLLLGHARLCDVFSRGGYTGMIGLAHHAAWVAPAHPENARDREAASLMDDLANRTVLDPLLLGTYPARVRAKLGIFIPPAQEHDMPELKRSGSYVGINYYGRNVYRWSRFLPFLHATEYEAPGSRRSAMWEIYAPGMRATLLRLKEEYGNPPCVVTENGIPFPDVPGRDPLADGERISYLQEHIAMVARAIAEGVDCRGYFHWSLTDNFEWNWGLSMRFGLLRTDYLTQERQWKKSAFWYRDLMHTNTLELPGPSAGLDLHL